MPLMLATPAFSPGGEIPTEYTCDGADISPALAWSGVPPGSKSLVVVIEDPDAPSGLFMHWAAYDIPPVTNGLSAGYGGGRPGSGFREGRNDFGTEGYRGPCPPRGGGTHHYVFRLLAISRPRLDLAPTASDADVLRAAQPYVIQQAELMGTFHR